MGDGIFEKECEIVKNSLPYSIAGRVSRIVGLVVEAEGMSVPIGSLCYIYPSFSDKPVEAEVVGFRENRTVLMAYGDIQGIKRYDKIVCVSQMQTVPVSKELLGRIVNPRGAVIDGKPNFKVQKMYPLYASSPKPLERERIREVLATGIKSIDGLVTCGKGQRVGLFSGSGVGKSTLLGMIARNTSADVTVIGLVGERGREVKEFIEDSLGEEGLRRSVVVVATSDDPPLIRSKAPFTATAIAEFFRDQGKDVILLMDSITRTAFAYREIGLSAGEPPTTKGYPPSTFAMLPKLLERAGKTQNGSITGIYTVLVEADDINEPIADTARSILDGHTWLARDLANKGHYPAVDILQSISRLMIDVVEEKHMEAAIKLKSLVAVYKRSEDLINIGAYVAGSNPEIDKAIKFLPKVNSFLQQGISEKVSFEEVKKKLVELTSQF